MRESTYQGKIIKKIKEMFPGCVIQKQDPHRMQGIPDILILYKKRWATLEFKKSKKSAYQNNQPYRIEQFNKMSFCRVIYPEIEKEVLDDLQQALQPRRATRISRSK